MWPWLAAAIGTYALSVLFSLLKFGCLPSYHTRSAKSCWLFMAVAVPFVFLELTPWPLRVAMVCVALANLEAVLITCLLRQPRSDVATAWLLLRRAGDKSRRDPDSPRT